MRTDTHIFVWVCSTFVWNSTQQAKLSQTSVKGMKAVSKTAETLQRILWPGWHQKKRRERKRGEKKQEKTQCKHLSPVLGRRFPPPLFTLSFISACCWLSLAVSPWFLPFCCVSGCPRKPRSKCQRKCTQETQRSGEKRAVNQPRGPGGWCSGPWLLLLSPTQARLLCFPWVNAKARPLIAPHALSHWLSGVCPRSCFWRLFLPSWV